MLPILSLAWKVWVASGTGINCCPDCCDLSGMMRLCVVLNVETSARPSPPTAMPCGSAQSNAYRFGYGNQLQTNDADGGYEPELVT